MIDEHRVLTPESVEFVYEVGGLGSRMLAAAVDHLLLLAAMILVVIAGLLGRVPSVGLMFAMFALYFGYFTYFEWKWNGQTPGKRALDLRVIDDRGMNIDLFQAIVRNLLRLVDLMPSLLPFGYLVIGFYGIGGITALVSPGRKRLGDWAAGTLVVRTRTRVLPEAVLAPGDKYNTLQDDPVVRLRIRGRLTLEEREMLLQLCLRRDELELEARQRLFAEAAEYLEGRLELARDAFLSEEKFVQNITAVALAETDLRNPRGPGR